jgi:hypothetical protein
MCLLNMSRQAFALQRIVYMLLLPPWNSAWALHTNTLSEATVLTKTNTKLQATRQVTVYTEMR